MSPINEKSESIVPPINPQNTHKMATRWRSPRTVIVLAVLFLVGLWHISETLPTHASKTLKKPISTKHTQTHKQQPLSAAKSPKLVQLEAHIMSKCPDAQDCILDLIVPAMSRLDPSHVNFTLSYIGSVSPNDDGVECRHGEEECLGNILQLCAADLYPDPKQYLGFTYCMEKRMDEIPHRALVQECAAEYGIEFEELNNCASRDDGSVGLKLLRDSVERTKKAGVKLSCTVRVDEKIWCIRDGGEWAGCAQGSRPDDLVKAVEKLYHARDS